MIKLNYVKGDKKEFEKFLNMSEKERLEYFYGIKLNLFQKIQIKLLNKWWTNIRKSSDLPAIVLFESIYKGRF